MLHEVFGIEFISSEIDVELARADGIQKRFEKNLAESDFEALVSTINRYTPLMRAYIMLSMLHTFFENYFSQEGLELEEIQFLRAIFGKLEIETLGKLYVLEWTERLNRIMKFLPEDTEQKMLSNAILTSSLDQFDAELRRREKII